MFFDHYPYTNFHNVNLDWVLQAVKAWGQTVEANDRAFRDLKEANEDFKKYVRNYLQDLDITDEINTKLDNMLASGILTPYFAPYVKGYVDSWLASHVTPTSPALDNTLTLSGAAARADAVGHRLKDLTYIDDLSTPEVVAALNRSQVLPGYRVQGITYDYDGHYYVCGGSVDETGTGVIVKMTKPDFTDAEITEIPQLGHANDITYYDGYLYVCTVGGGDAPQWGIYKINVNDFTDKTLISNAPENTIGISYRQGDFWILAPYRIYRTTDFTSYEVVVANTNDLLTAYGIPTSGRISQTLFRAAGYLIGWVCSFVYEERHYGAITFFSSTGEPVAFKMFPAYHSELQCAVYAHMSIWLLSDGNLVNVFRMDPRNLSYIQLKAGDDLNDFTGRGTLYSTGSNVSAELLNSPSSGEGFTVQVDRLGVYNTIQTARTNSGRELYRIKSFNTDTWGEWIEPATEVAKIKEDLSGLKEYNAYDIFRDAPYSYENKTQYGVSWQWDVQNKVCTVSGTATQMARNRFFVDTTSLHSSIVPGKTYYIKYHSTGTAPALYVAWFTNGSMTSYKYYRANAEVEVPSDATGCIIGLQISAGGSVDGTVSVQMLTSEPDCVLSETVNTILEQLSADKKFYGIDFAPMYFDFSTVTHNGVSFTWDATKRTCKVSGTTAPDTANDILCSGKLPEGMNEGDKFLIRFKLDKIQSIAVRVYFYDGNGNILLDKYSALHKIGNASADIPFEVPVGSATWRIKVYVPYRASDPITVDATVTRLQLFKTTPRKMEVPLIVSFIDDDTTNDTYVTRFHDSCCHNGITGNYAVITDRIGDTTSLAKLLQYEDEGFGMLIHAKDQNPTRTPYWSPKDEQGNPRAHTTEEINLCRANLCAGLRKMREDGFVNFNYWVTPGGHHEDEIIEMAKQLGLECMIPTNNFRYNSMQDCTKWIIRRISLDNTTQSGAAENLQFVKDKIDEAVEAGGGWLIITTHYNEGWSSTDTWDDTLDSNGYPIGYERFNEIAQYAIASGLVPMTIPQAWEYYRIIIEANHSEYQRTIT